MLFMDDYMVRGWHLDGVAKQNFEQGCLDSFIIATSQLTRDSNKTQERRIPFQLQTAAYIQGNAHLYKTAT